MISVFILKKRANQNRNKYHVLCIWYVIVLSVYSRPLAVSIRKHAPTPRPQLRKLSNKIPPFFTEWRCWGRNGRFVCEQVVIVPVAWSVNQHKCCSGKFSSERSYSRGIYGNYNSREYRSRMCNKCNLQRIPFWQMRKFLPCSTRMFHCPGWHCTTDFRFNWLLPHSQELGIFQVGVKWWNCHEL